MLAIYSRILATTGACRNQVVGQVPNTYRYRQPLILILKLVYLVSVAVTRKIEIVSAV
jgi:hypothetical protein